MDDMYIDDVPVETGAETNSPEAGLEDIQADVDDALSGDYTSTTEAGPEDITGDPAVDGEDTLAPETGVEDIAVDSEDALPPEDAEDIDVDAEDTLAPEDVEDIEGDMGEAPETDYTPEGDLDDIQDDVDDSLDWEDVPEEGPGEDLSPRDAEVQEGIETLTEMEELNPEVWAELSDAERVEVAQEVENQMAEIQGRPSVEIRAADLGPGTWGGYNPETRDIEISSDAIHSANVQQVVDTIVHEGRHAYQHHAVDNPGFHPDEVEAAAWTENFMDYKTPDLYGYEEYRNQPLEADAWSYGSDVANGLYNQ